MDKRAFYSKDEDYPETIFYDGLNLVDITVDPHFDVNDASRVKESIKGSIEHEIIGLTDESTIIIDEKSNVEYIGEKYIFINGKKV